MVRTLQSNQSGAKRTRPLMVTIVCLLGLLTALTVIVAQSTLSLGMAPSLSSNFIGRWAVGEGTLSRAVALGSMTLHNGKVVTMVGTAACACLPSTGHLNVGPMLYSRFQDRHPWLMWNMTGPRRSHPYVPARRIATPESRAKVGLDVPVTQDESFISWIDPAHLPPSVSARDTHILELKYFPARKCKRYNDRPSGVYEMCYSVIHIQRNQNLTEAHRAPNHREITKLLAKDVLGSLPLCPRVKSTPQTPQQQLQRVLNSCSCDRSMLQPQLIDVSDAQTQSFLQTLPGSSPSLLQTLVTDAATRQDAGLNDEFARVVARKEESARGAEGEQRVSTGECDLDGHLFNIPHVIDERLPLVSSFKMLTLNNSALLLCYHKGVKDIVCDVTGSAGAWEADSVQQLETALLAARKDVEVAFQILSAMAKGATTLDDRTTPGGASIREWRKDGVELIDLGANVGGFAFSLWQRGFNVRSFEALSYNVQLLRMARALNIIRESSQLGIDQGAASFGEVHVTHVGLSNETIGECAMFSPNSNFGDTHMRCDVRANQSKVMGNYLNRGTVPVKSLDAVFDGNGSAHGEEKAFDHTSPLAATAADVLNSVGDEAEIPSGLARHIPCMALPTGYEKVFVELPITRETSRKIRRNLMDKVKSTLVTFGSSGNGLVSGKIAVVDAKFLRVELTRERMKRCKPTIRWLKSQLQTKQYIVKIDVEGHELDAMEGAQAFVQQHRPRMVFSEIWSTLNITKYSELMISRHGYLMYVLSRKGLWFEDVHAATEWWRSISPRGYQRLQVFNCVFVLPEYAHLVADDPQKSVHQSKLLNAAAVDVVARSSGVDLTKKASKSKDDEMDDDDATTGSNGGGGDEVHATQDAREYVRLPTLSP